MTCNVEQIGQLLSYDGSPVSFDALGQHAFKMDFAKIPNTMFFLQGVTFPGLSVSIVEQATPHLDFQEIGTKVRYDPLIIHFLVDARMRNHFEITNWLKEMTEARNQREYVSDALMTINDSMQIRFIDAFPVSIGSIEFVSNQDSLKYIQCSATFNFDWFEIIPI